MNPPLTLSQRSRPAGARTQRRPAGRLLAALVLVTLVGNRPAIGADTPPTAEQALARQILQDPRLDRVRNMGLELLGTGLTAGSGYGEVWIRDLNTFLVPALQTNPPARLREALLVFFHFQGPEGDIVDGYIPADRATVGYGYRTAASQPGLKAHKNTVETDQESSLVLAIGRYVKATGDRTILTESVLGESVRDRLERALQYPLKHRFSAAHGLIWGATTADWGDVQPEHAWGVELDGSSHRSIDIYDNALFLTAVDAAQAQVWPEDAARVQAWSRTRDALARAVRKGLWDSWNQKFTSHIYLEGSPFPADFDESKVFYHGGTTVAVEAGLLSPTEILVSYGQMVANRRLAGAATIGLTLYPPYPAGTFKNPAMGPYSYQNGGDWTWFGARTVRQLAEHGFGEAAYRELIPMLDRVLKHNGFFEWWTPDNQPRGSAKFRGSAGVLCEAIDSLKTWARGQLAGRE